MISRLALFLLPFLALSACREEHEWHQKLTVTVETPAGERTGAAVVEVRAIFGRQVMSQAEVQYGYSGEATAVEVEPGKYLFALLGGTEERYACAAGKALGWSGPWNPSGDIGRGAWLAEVPRQAGLPAVTVTGKCMPLMVIFGDIHDPKSVQRVDPGDLRSSFGPEVRLKAVTLSVTDEAVTEGRVEAVLGWFCGHLKPYRRLSGKSGPIADNKLANNLGPGAFSTGACK